MNSSVHNRSALFMVQANGLGTEPDLNMSSNPGMTTSGAFIPTGTASVMSQKKSLNRDARRRELIKITLEN